MAEDTQDEGPASSIIESSPASARLIVFGSGEFLDDLVFNISSSLSQDRYLNSLQLLQNAVSWATEDLDLLEIRGGGSAVRVLAPMEERDQAFWEGANYVIALFALGIVGFFWSMGVRNEEPMALDESKSVTRRGAGSAEVEK
jgi:ABC-2 type transport system permease protein